MASHLFCDPELGWLQVLCDFGEATIHWQSLKCPRQDPRMPTVSAVSSLPGWRIHTLLCLSNLSQELNGNVITVLSTLNFLQGASAGCFLAVLVPLVWLVQTHHHWAELFACSLLKACRCPGGSAANNVAIVPIFWLDVLFPILCKPCAPDLLGSYWLPLIKSPAPSLSPDDNFCHD